MDAVQHTYMLLPNFRFRPNEQIQLGTIIGHDSHAKLPNPYDILNEGHTASPPSPQHDVIADWEGTVEEKESAKVGLRAEIASLFSVGAGGKIGGGSDGSLVSTSSRMEIRSFLPDRAYKLEAFGYAPVVDYTKGAFGNPVYLVTGIMVANGTTFDLQKGKTVDRAANFTIDGTPYAIPIKVEPEVQYSKELKSRSAGKLAEPLILTYQVLRMKNGIFGRSEKMHTELTRFDGGMPDKPIRNADENWETAWYSPSNKVADL